MKLVWCPETASKAYIDAVTALAGRELVGTHVAELVSALASGWKAQLIVETWGPGGSPATGIGLSTAARHTGGRHLCIVPDEQAENEYTEALRRAGVDPTAVEMAIGEAEEVIGGMEGVDFMVVDGRCKNAEKMMKKARAGPRGMVVVCKNMGGRQSGGGGEAAVEIVGEGMRVVRSAFLPVGRGLEIVHVGVRKGLRSACCRRRRWFKHVDRNTGEEHMFPK